MSTKQTNKQTNKQANTLPPTGLPSAGRVVRQYNRLSQVLTEYEVLYYNAWTRQLESAQEGLKASLLVRHPDTHEIFINLDEQIPALVRETTVMSRFGLEIPEQARTLLSKGRTVKECHDQLKLLLSAIAKQKAGVKEVLRPLVQHHLKRVDEVLEPAFTRLSWHSLNTKPLIQSIFSTLKELDTLFSAANNILDNRIEAGLREMGALQLSALPEQEPWSPEHFLSRVEDTCTQSAHQLFIKNAQVEQASKDLVALLLSSFQDPQLPDHLKDANLKQLLTQGASEEVSLRPGDLSLIRRKLVYREIQEEAAELRAHLIHRNLEALVRSARLSLDALRRRITVSSMISYGETDSKKDQSPAFSAQLILALPNIEMRPALDEIQQMVNRAAQTIVSIFKQIPIWGQTDVKKSAEVEVSLMGGPSLGQMTTSQVSNNDGAVSRVRLDGGVRVKNYYRSVSEHKEVAKLVSILTSGINSTKSLVTKATASFQKYSHVWSVDRDKRIAEFLEASPHLSDFKAEITYFQVSHTVTCIIGTETNTCFRNWKGISERNRSESMWGRWLCTQRTSRSL